MNSKERTGWRDERISRQHREWKYWVPAMDVDFLLCEFERHDPPNEKKMKVCAWIEYKSMKYDADFAGRFSNKEAVWAIRNMLEPIEMPFYVVFCEDIDPDTNLYQMFSVCGLNSFAMKKLLAFDGLNFRFHEAKYNRFLHWLRGIGKPEKSAVPVRGVP